MDKTNYAPKAGSKAAQAVAALAAGPMTRADIATAIGSNLKDLDSVLFLAVENQLLVKLRHPSGDIYYALANQATPAGMSVISRKTRISDDPIVRVVTTPSVRPSAEAIAAANPFWPGFSLTPVEEESNPQSKDGPDAERQAVDQKPGDFVAGLLSNGELLISDGIQTIKLGSHHTKALFDYLDKVTDMIVGSSGALQY